MFGDMKLSITFSNLSCRSSQFSRFSLAGDGHHDGAAAGYDIVFQMEDLLPGRFFTEVSFGLRPSVSVARKRPESENFAGGFAGCRQTYNCPCLFPKVRQPIFAAFSL